MTSIVDFFLCDFQCFVTVNCDLSMHDKMRLHCCCALHLPSLSLLLFLSLSFLCVATTFDTFCCALLDLYFFENKTEKLTKWSTRLRFTFLIFGIFLLFFSCFSYFCWAFVVLCKFRFHFTHKQRNTQAFKYLIVSETQRKTFCKGKVNMYRVNRFSPIYTAIYCAAFVRSLFESFSGNALCHLRYVKMLGQSRG